MCLGNTSIPMWPIASEDPHNTHELEKAALLISLSRISVLMLCSEV